MSSLRTVWILVLFQAFFISTLYMLMFSQYVGTQQGSANINIISVQRQKRTPPENTNMHRTQESTSLKSYPHPSSNSTAKSTNVTRSTSRTGKISNDSDNLPSHPLTTFLLIMVPILPSSFHNREVIRDTWYKGFTDGEDVMLRFAIGVRGIDVNLTKQLADENSTHKDLIFFEDLKENKSALTNKTLKLMQWACDNVNFTYFLKCDDDTYVFINRMLLELRKRPTTKRLYYGIIDKKGKPKKEGNAWSDLDWDLAETYLPYALGGGYILSSDLVNLIVEDIEYLQWRPNEDTAVGSWLAPYNYERRHDKLICIMFFNKKKSKKCPGKPIMRLFFGIKREELDKMFVEYSKADT